MCFLGYPLGQKAYKLYDLETHHVFTSRDVVSHEGIFPYESINTSFTTIDLVIPNVVSDNPSFTTLPYTPPPLTENTICLPLIPHSWFPCIILNDLMVLLQLYEIIFAIR